MGKSGTTKAGIAGDDAPACVFPSVLGYPKNATVMAGEDVGGVYIGAEAVAKKSVLEISHPIDRGIVCNWDELERLWQHTFTSELRREPAEHSVLFTEPPLTPKGNREKMITMAFERFDVPGTYIANSAVLALYASGCTTGLVLSSGDGITHTVPIYEGFAQNKTVGKLDFGGNDLTGSMMEMLAKEGISLTTSAEYETVRQVKEELCYVSSDIESENVDDGRQFKLPDGHVISVGQARYLVPERLFTPELGQGIQNLVFDSIMKSDVDTRTTLFNNVVLAGGSTLFEGLARRLESELSNLVPPSTKVNVVAPPERKYSTWIGGSILAALSTFDAMAISAAEYNELGPSVVHRKCF